MADAPVPDTPAAGAAAPDAAPAGAVGGPAPSAETTLWRPVGSWSGSGDRQTESFDVTTGALRLVWEASGAPDAGGRLRVAVHSAISGRPLHTVVDQEGPGADTVLVALSPRVAHLQIDSERLDWHLTLQERVAETRDEGGR